MRTKGLVINYGGGGGGGGYKWENHGSETFLRPLAFWGTRKLHRDEKIRRVLVLNSYLDPPPPTFGIPVSAPVIRHCNDIPKSLFDQNHLKLRI